MPVIANSPPNRVVAWAREPEMLGDDTNPPPRFGKRLARIVERLRRIEEPAVDTRRDGCHRKNCRRRRPARQSQESNENVPIVSM
jgi:hypothetical protein